MQSFCKWRPLSILARDAKPAPGTVISGAGINPVPFLFPLLELMVQVTSSISQPSCALLVPLSFEPFISPSFTSILLYYITPLIIIFGLLNNHILCPLYQGLAFWLIRRSLSN